MTEFVPQNQLETLLMQAATDPGARPAFYRAFLDSDLLVVGEVSNVVPGSSGQAVAQEGSQLSVLHMQDKNGDPVIPVFSSMPRLQEAINQQVTYVQLKGSALLQTVGSALPIVLNPMSPYGKEFLSGELASLIDGSMFEGPHAQTIAKDTQVLLGQPANYPQTLVDGLKSLFSRHPEVLSAYLAQIYDASSGAPPHAVVGIETTGDWDALMRDAGLVSSQTMGQGELVDFLPIVKGDGTISDYMLHSVEPFYKKDDAK